MGLFGKKTAGPQPMHYADAYRAAYGDTPDVSSYWAGWIPRTGLGQPGDRFLAQLDDDMNVTIDGVIYGRMAEPCHAAMREALAAWGSPMKIVLRVAKASAANDQVQIPRRDR